MLPVFACALNREHAHDPVAHKAGVDLVMEFLEPFCSRPNLLVLSTTPHPTPMPLRAQGPCCVVLCWQGRRGELLTDSP